LAKFVDETLACALQKGLDPMSLERSMIHRATAIVRRFASRKLVFVECHSEFVDDYLAELRKELSEFNVEVREMPTNALAGVGNGKSPVDQFLRFVQRMVSPF
jgi:hypothetical protein